MAAYSIVLNLSGNAVTRTERLADSLARANSEATRLAASLGAVGSAARTVPSTPLRASRGRVPSVASRTAASRVPVTTGRTTASPPLRGTTSGATGGTNADPRYTRHRYTRIASFGSGFNIGGFSGRLSTILQPDSNGKILGLNASSIFKAVNIAGIATNVMASVGKALLKITAYSTLAPIAIGGGGLMVALRALQSESFSEGVRLIARRNQARLGLGEGFEQAQSNADFLAQGYGFDRSTSLSSINTLTGLGVGGGSRRLSIGEATGLTKIGGLISQQAGVPFERVMTNIQQLLVQATPSIRDIRELLGQAPILGKYALREMESRGVVGVDVRTYLKEQRNLLSVLRAFEIDNASNAGMQARGVIALAQQDAWATIAGNDPFWSYAGRAGSGVIGSLGTGVNNLLTNLANNQTFQVMVKQIELMFDNLGTKGVTFIDKLINLVDGLAARFGIDLGDKNQARLEVDLDRTIQTAVTTNPYLSGQIRDIWENSTLPVSQNPEIRNQEFQRFLNQSVLPRLLQSEDVRNSVEPEFPLTHLSNSTWAERFFGFPNFAAETRNEIALNNRAGTSQFPQAWTRYYPNVTSLTEPDSQYGMFTLRNDRVRDAVTGLVDEMSRTGSLDPSAFPRTGSGATGDDLTGMNRDRKALTINFNNKLVEWNSNITSSSPEEVVDEVAQNIEQITSRAIQVALLGASNKMGTRWY